MILMNRRGMDYFESLGEETDADTEENTIPINPRRTYLETIGLSLDPFATPVAEQELALSAYSLARRESKTERESGPESPSFFAYYSPPSFPLPEGQTILQALRQTRPAFLYGQPGMGKTTLRLTLEAECRRVPDRTLVVSYILAEDIARPLTPEQHWNRLAKALAIDLFVQIVEQFNPLSPPPTSDQIHALRNQLLVGGRSLKRLAERILDEPEPEALLGLGLLWPAVGRSAVRYVARSEPLLDLIAKSIPADWLFPTRPLGEAALLAGFQAARLWDFERIFLLIDGVDTRQRTVPNMLALIRPLFENLGAWQENHVVPKFFLPIELQPPMSERAGKAKLELRLKPFEAIIEWDDVSLRHLLVERFRAARSRRLSFDDLAGPDLKGKLDTLILRAAQGSPRRLLFTVSSLIDIHSARDPHDPLISLADWERMREAWGCQPPPPPAAADA